MIIDISIPLSPDMLRWEGDPPMLIRQVLKITEGADYNLSQVKMSVHQGTHLDAPRHFLDEGALIEDFPLELLVGDAQVVQIPREIESITAEVLRGSGLQPGMQRILLKTRNSEFWKNCPHEFQQDFVSLSLDGAGYLVEQGVRLVGIDYLSISPGDNFRPVHARLMENNIAIVETLDLSETEAGIYQLICLPLKLVGVEGAPVRAILLRD